MHGLLHQISEEILTRMKYFSYYDWLCWWRRFYSRSQIWQNTGSDRWLLATNGRFGAVLLQFNAVFDHGNRSNLQFGEVFAQLPPINMTKHLMAKRKSAIERPVFLGPCFVQMHKKHKPTSAFLSCLIGKKNGLRDLKAYWSDGEVPLVKCTGCSISWCHLFEMLYWHERQHGRPSRQQAECKIWGEVSIFFFPMQFYLQLQHLLYLHF